METCRSCQAFLQPTWDRCKICGEPRTAEPPAEDGAAPRTASAGPAPGDAAGPAGGDPHRPGGGGNRALVVAGGVGLVLLLLAGLAVTIARPDAGGGDDGIVPGAGAAATTAPPDDPDSTDADELEALCTGATATVTPSAPYPGDRGPLHPISFTVLGDTRDSTSPVGLPLEWRVQDSSVRPVELVLCVTVAPGGATQPCEGFETNLPVVIEDATWNAELRSASTGQVLASQTFPGTSGCPQAQILLQPGQRDEVRLYRTPDDAAVAAFVAPFVTG